MPVGEGRRSGAVADGSASPVRQVHEGNSSGFFSGRASTRRRLPVWLDEQGKLFGFFVGLGCFLPAGEADLKPLIAARGGRDCRTDPADRAGRLLTAEARQPILFRNVKIYDADKERFGPRMSWSATARSRWLGTALPKLPAGAKVIDGTGKTLVPGLWDNRMHVSDDFNVC